MLQASHSDKQPEEENPHNPSKWFSRGKPLALRESIDLPLHILVLQTPCTTVLSPLEVSKLTGLPPSYNRYLAIASRVVRRSLKEEKRLVAERRGEMELRFAKWQVSLGSRLL